MTLNYREDENKTRIGPSITQGTSLPSQSSVQAMSRLPPRSIAESSLPKPAPAAVPPPAQATPVLQLQPQGVPAPQSLIMAGRPGMVMMPTAQPPQPILPPRPLIGNLSYACSSPDKILPSQHCYRYCRNAAGCAADGTASVCTPTVQAGDASHPDGRRSTCHRR